MPVGDVRLSACQEQLIWLSNNTTVGTASSVDVFLLTDGFIINQIKQRLAELQYCLVYLVLPSKTNKLKHQ